eukprot:57194_1
MLKPSILIYRTNVVHISEATIPLNTTIEETILIQSNSPAINATHAQQSSKRRIQSPNQTIQSISNGPSVVEAIHPYLPHQCRPQSHLHHMQATSNQHNQ